MFEIQIIIHQLNEIMLRSFKAIWKLHKSDEVVLLAAILTELIPVTFVILSISSFENNEYNSLKFKSWVGAVEYIALMSIFSNLKFTLNTLNNLIETYVLFPPLNLELQADQCIQQLLEHFHKLFYLHQKLVYYIQQLYS